MMFLLHTASPDSTTKFGEGSQMNDIMEDIPHFFKNALFFHDLFQTLCT